MASVVDFDLIKHTLSGSHKQSTSITSVHYSTAENSPRAMHYLLLFEKWFLEKTQCSAVLGNYEAFIKNETHIFIDPFSKIYVFSENEWALGTLRDRLTYCSPLFFRFVDNKKKVPLQHFNANLAFVSYSFEPLIVNISIFLLFTWFEHFIFLSVLKVPVVFPTISS